MKSVQFWQMSFWQPSKVVLRFESGEMQNSEKFVYLVVFLISALIFGELSMFVPHTTSMNLWDVVSICLSFCIYLWGLSYLYKLHKTPSSFVEKVIIFSVATAPQVVVKVLLPVMVFGTILYTFYFQDITLLSPTTWIDVLMNSVFFLGSFIVMKRYFIQKI